MKYAVLWIIFGLVLGFVACHIIYQRKAKNAEKAEITSVTKWLFVNIYRAAVAWVSISYAIALYSTVALGQVYTMAELSGPALTALLTTVGVKVLENIFEYNENAVFGKSVKDLADGYEVDKNEQFECDTTEVENE